MENFALREIAEKTLESGKGGVFGFKLGLFDEFGDFIQNWNELNGLGRLLGLLLAQTQRFEGEFPEGINGKAVKTAKVIACVSAKTVLKESSSMLALGNKFLPEGPGPQVHQSVP